MAGRTITLTLPSEVLDELDARVAAGAVLSLEEGIADAVLGTSGEGLSAWIETEVAARYDRVLAGEPTLTIAELRAGLERRRKARPPLLEP